MRINIIYQAMKWLGICFFTLSTSVFLAIPLHAETAKPQVGASGPASAGVFDLSNDLTGVWQSEQSCGGTADFKFRFVATEFFGTRYGILKGVDNYRGTERIRFAVYDLDNRVDSDGDFFIPKKVFDSLGGPNYALRLSKFPSKDSIVLDHGYCRNHSLSTLAPASNQDKPSPFASQWQGYVDACKHTRNFPYDLQITFRELPDGMLVAFARDPNAKDPDSIRRRSAFLHGQVNSSNTASLRILGLNPKAKDTLSLEYSSEKQKMFGHSDGLFAGACEYVELIPDAALGSTPTASQESSSKTVPTILGDWEGAATCNSQPVRVLLSITNAPARKYAGAIEYSFPNVLLKGVVLQGLIGEKQDNGSYIFSVDTRLNRRSSNPAIPQGFSVNPPANGDTLQVQHDEDRCTALQIARLTADSASRKVRASGDDKGSFFKVRRPRQRCEAVAAWLDRAAMEYPEIDFRKTLLGQVYPKLVLLFADDEFVPVFGKPYDALSLSEAREIVSTVSQLCERDPVSSKLIKDFSLVKGFFSGIDSIVGPTSGAGTRSTIRETRRIRNQFEEITSSLSDDASFDIAVQTLAPLMERARNLGEYLWPGEMRELEKSLSTRLGNFAMIEAESDIRRVDLIGEPATRLDEMTAIDAGNPQYHQYLLPEQKAALHERLVGAQRNIADGLFSGTLAALDALVVEVPSLSKIASMEDDMGPTMAQLITETRQFYEEKFESVRESMLRSLIDERIQVLKTFTADRVGLLANSGWIAEFDQSFASFKDHPLFQQSIADFTRIRRQLLREGIASFETDLENSSLTNRDGSIDVILGDYLSWEGDLRMPISLEYLIVAEARKASN